MIFSELFNHKVDEKLKNYRHLVAGNQTNNVKMILAPSFRSYLNSNNGEHWKLTKIDRAANQMYLDNDKLIKHRAEPALIKTNVSKKNKKNSTPFNCSNKLLR